MIYLFRILGALWLLPVTVLVWGAYILPLWIMGEVICEGWHSFLIVRFRLAPWMLSQEQGKGGTWYQRQWTNWSGSALPHAIIYKPWGRASKNFIWVHEERHNDQQFLFGPLFYPLYGLCWLTLWLYKWVQMDMTGTSSVIPYLDNPFEKDASKEFWRRGGNP